MISKHVPKEGGEENKIKLQGVLNRPHLLELLAGHRIPVERELRESEGAFETTTTISSYNGF